MIINDQESEYRICPRLVYVGADPGSGSGCFGSQCAAWRWAKVRNPDWNPVSAGMTMVTPSHPDDVEQPYIQSETHGYCGLAGEP